MALYCGGKATFPSRDFSGNGLFFLPKNLKKTCNLLKNKSLQL